VLSELKASKGEVSRSTRLRLAQKVFAHTGKYDSHIAEYLSRTVR
jgi:phosphoribosylaminoimidazolecarboxamide formyltransferase/IMP cyclohydrolase